MKPGEGFRIYTQGNLLARNASFTVENGEKCETLPRGKAFNHTNNFF